MRVIVDLTSMRILRWREVAPIIGYSRMTIARMEKAGTFP
jgi:predicted DNA-binding transcriptional regulator AlpA